MTYTEARAKAQENANRYGFDYGVEKVYDGYTCYMLPRRENRYGHELRCEVVHPERLSACQPGHGPDTPARYSRPGEVAASK